MGQDVYSKYTNFVKLQSFQKKVYAIGIYDDPLRQMVPIKKEEVNGVQLVEKDYEAESEEEGIYNLKLVENIKLIRDVVRDLRPASLVVEMCDDRYERWLGDVVNHPDYSATII